MFLVRREKSECTGQNTEHPEFKGQAQASCGSSSVLQANFGQGGSTLTPKHINNMATLQDVSKRVCVFLLYKFPLADALSLLMLFAERAQNET